MNLYHGVDALVDLRNRIVAAELADDLEGELHRAAGGEAGNQLAVHDDPLVTLDLRCGKLALHGGMTDDLLFGLQPAMGR